MVKNIKNNYNIKKGEQKAMSMIGSSAGKINEGQTKEAKKDEAVKAEVKAKKVTEPKLKELHIDQANPYEYRHGIAHELNQLDDYSADALEKAKTTVLKNLAKDANFYSNLLNQQQSPFEFKKSETDAKGMQARSDGHMKKEAKKDEKANVKDNLGKKEAGKTKPKGVKIMPDKGVEGKEKTIKEGVDDKVEDMIKSGKIKPEEVKAAAEKAMKGDSSELAALMAGFKLAEDTVEEHHNDPNFPGGSSIHNMLDAVSEDWGKDSDLYNELEDAIVGWSDRNGNLSDKGKLAIKALLSNWDVLDDYAHFLDNPMEEGFQGQFYAPEYLENKYGKETAKKIEAEIDEMDPNSWDRFTGMESAEEVEAYIADIKDMLGLKEGSFMGGVDLGGSFEKMKSSMGDEAKFEDLMKKYDWYAEMSDDTRKWDAQQAMERELKMLAQSIGADKAAEIWNRNAPEDRKIQSSYFMREDKHAKLKETLKAKLKEYVKYSIGTGTTTDTEYRGEPDTDLENKLRKARVPFTKVRK